jgi:hypothetical protein
VALSSSTTYGDTHDFMRAYVALRAYCVRNPVVLLHA